MLFHGVTSEHRVWCLAAGLLLGVLGVRGADAPSSPVGDLSATQAVIGTPTPASVTPWFPNSALIGVPVEFVIDRFVNGVETTRIGSSTGCAERTHLTDDRFTIAALPEVRGDR